MNILEFKKVNKIGDDNGKMPKWYDDIYNQVAMIISMFIIAISIVFTYK